MRIWSLHPRYLDAKGLVALWRETLLAQHVLLGKTKGYRNHPQLNRFKAHPAPVDAVSAYLRDIATEADNRGYKFDSSKIAQPNASPTLIPVTDGQLAYEWKHLKIKLETRDPATLARWEGITIPELHPLFTLTKGNIESWEKQ